MRLSIIALTAALFTAPAFAQDAAPGGSATFIDAAGAEIGTVELTAMDDGVHVTGTLAGLAQGTHGIHFHQVGTCDPATEFESAGEHFNPAAKQHGMENPEGPHAGDLPNIESIAEGQVVVDLHSDLVTLDDGENGLFDADGSALVIHENADDMKTDPSGNSGARIACAVIEAAEAM